MKAALSRGMIFAGYRVDELVGRGGMGVVYRATDLSLERPVALKLVAPELAEDERFRERFLREPRMAAALDHPHVIPIYEAGEHDGQLYLAMRFVEGSDLRTILEREEKLPPERALPLLAEVADALDAAHRRALVHRDVKPANVLLDEDGHAYLTDFGITKQVGGDSTDTGRVVGTLDYVAPEQIRGDPVDGGADVYALGCVLYECLAGAPPFRRATEAETLWAHMQEQPAPLRGHPRLDPVLRKALAKDREDRYETCSELVEAAAAALGRWVGRAARRPLIPPVLRERGRLLLAGGLLLAVAVAAAIVALTTGGDSRIEPLGKGVAETAIAGGHARALDPRTGKPLATVPLGTAPVSIAAGAGGVWVLDAEDRTISQIDPQEHSLVRTFSTASTPTDLAVGTGTLWIGNGFRNLGTALPTSVSRLDTESANVDETIALPGRSRTAAVRASQASLRPHIAATRDAVWVVNPDLTVSRISARTNDVVARVTGVQALSIAAGDGEVWVVDDRGELVEIDPRTNRVSNRIEVAAASLTALAVGAGAVWVADPEGGSVWRIDPEPEPILRTIPLEVGVAGIAFGEGAVWATNELSGEVYRIDPRTNRARVVSRIASARGIAVGEGAVWVTAAPTRTSDAALPSFACSPANYAGAGTPRFLIASDLPLHGADRVATVPMVEAIRVVLDRHDFRAGRFTVGYQSCDDSTAQAGTYDLHTCFSNAKAYARNLDVIGVIGAYNSGCSAVQIPVTNQAPDGPLAMISTSNTHNGLTRPYEGMRRGELEARYPSGERNYVRIAAADHLQSVANATLVKELGLRDLFVLSPDGDRYFTADMRTAARNLGLRIVGSANWNTEASEFTRLARRIARTHAEAVFIAGLLDPHGDALVRDLRAQLGRDVALMATDWFSTIPDLLSRAGSAAQGMYVSVTGVANKDLPRRGRRLLEELEAASGRKPSSPSTAVYAAQATEILLDAIARSEGTRSSVTRELRRTSVEEGILGNIRFDQNGDLVEGPVTIFRVVGKRQRNSSSPPEFRGAVVDRTITARAALLR
jgi:ABC-type branched-subunit amino acid transport system substrate-binding protein